MVAIRFQIRKFVLIPLQRDPFWEQTRYLWGDSLIDTVRGAVAFLGLLIMGVCDSLHCGMNIQKGQSWHEQQVWEV